MRLVNSAFSEIVENRNIYLPQGITHLHLGKIFFFILPHQARPDGKYFPCNSDYTRKTETKRQLDKIQVG